MLNNHESGAVPGPVSVGGSVWKRILAVVIGAACLASAVALLCPLLGSGERAVSGASGNTDIMAIYDQALSGQIGDALEGVIPVKREYWLSDSDLVAPEPNPEGYGQTDDPAVLAEVIAAAQPLLEGQELLFTPQISLMEGSQVVYYLDDTIFAITWKQVIDNCVYTFSEVKIAHPSQIRRFFSEGKYNAGVLRTTTEMSRSVNAVVASSGDYYEYRSFGIVVNNGQVYRHYGQLLDTLYIDENGDFLYSYAGEFREEEQVKQFVRDNKIRFSICFGPVMIRDGQCCVPQNYNSGEINSRYARAAIGQMDKLHYVVVAANMEGSYLTVPTVAQVADNLQAMGVPNAYALDGGQTAAIVMQDQLINKVSYGSQREISDILYFATAIPESGEKEVGK